MVVLAKSLKECHSLLEMALAMQQGQSPVTGCNKLVPSGAAVLVQRDVPASARDANQAPSAGGCCHLTAL